MSNRSLYRDQFIDPVRLPTRGRARIPSSMGATAGGAGQGNLNYYFPCGDQMPWQSPADGSQPDAATLLSHIVPAAGASAPLQIKDYATNMFTSTDRTDHNPPDYTLSPLWDGSFPQWLSGLNVNPIAGVYYWFMANIPAGSSGFTIYWNEQDPNYPVDWFIKALPYYNTPGNYNPKYRSLSVRVIRGKIYWLVALCTSDDWVIGCWYKICGMTPYGDYTLVKNNFPPGTVASDWPEWNPFGSGFGNVYSMNGQDGAQLDKITIIAKET